MKKRIYFAPLLLVCTLTATLLTGCVNNMNTMFQYPSLDERYAQFANQDFVLWYRNNLKTGMEKYSTDNGGFTGAAFNFTYGANKGKLCTVVTMKSFSSNVNHNSLFKFVSQEMRTFAQNNGLEINDFSGQLALKFFETDNTLIPETLLRPRKPQGIGVVLLTKDKTPYASMIYIAVPVQDSIINAYNDNGYMVFLNADMTKGVFNSVPRDLIERNGTYF